MIIYQKKISPKHNDSIWYDGVIATTEDKKYELLATGEVRIYKNDGDLVFDGKLRNDGIEGGFENDDDLRRAMGDNGGYYFDMNNWFEIVERDNNSNFSEIYDDYDEAIKTLNILETN